MGFGENLQILRKQAGLTQEQFAEKLNVTRQAVSKWESENGFPEMEKIIQIREMFGYDIDTLLFGCVEQKKNTDIFGYNRRMECHAYLIATGVFLCIVSCATAALIDDVWSSEWAGIAFFVCLFPAILMLVLEGIWHSQFCQTHPYIEPFYEEETIQKARKQYPIWIIAGIGCILASPLIWSLEQFAPWTDAIGLYSIALGVFILILGQLRYEKYRLDVYNEQHQIERDTKQEQTLCSKIQGTIMLVATILFLSILFILFLSDQVQQMEYIQIGYFSGGIYSIAGILCGILQLWMGKK